MSKERPTMKDVADLAGVTQPTVSYVINGTANISGEVREKVNQAIRELNYKPNYFARVLKTNKTDIIGVVIPDISNEYYARITYTAESMLKKKGYTIIIYSTNYDREVEEKSIKQLLTYNAEGIIIMYELGNPKCWDMLQNSGKTAVVLEGGNNCGNIPCINTDNYFGTYTATKYLLSKGRKKIAYIGQNVKIEALEERCRGYREAMEEAGLLHEDLICNTSGPGDKWREGVILGHRLATSDVDGVIVSSDIIAVGILKTLLIAGKRIPHDVSIIGYDDIPLAELFVPALTTVAQPIEQMCSLAVEMIGSIKELKNESLKPKLVIRETT